MIFPLRIHYIQDNSPLQPPQQVRAELFFFFLIPRFHRVRQRFGQLVVVQSSGVRAHRLCIDSKLAVRFGQQLRGVPLPGMLLARAICLHQFARHIFGDPQHVIALIFSLQRGAANRVNRLALLVHYVVVFQQVLASVKVLRFYGFLRVFDAIRNQLGFDRHAFRHAQAEHHLLHALAAENPH